MVQQIDLSELLTPGRHTLTLTDQTASRHRVSSRLPLPRAGRDAQLRDPLSIQVVYDRERLQVGDVLWAKATIANRGTSPAPMLLAELPLPAGFTLQAEDFAKLADVEAIAKFQVQAGKVLVYLRNWERARRWSCPIDCRPTPPPS